MKKYLALSLFLPFIVSQLFAQINITSGTQVKVVGNAQIVVQDLNWIQNGTLSNTAGTIVFKGNSSTTVSGQNVNFYRMVIDKSGANLSLSDSINVADQVLFVQGNIDLNGKLLDLGTAGRLNNESENSRLFSSVINGKVMREENYRGGIISADSGNLGIRITTTSAMGRTIIVRSHDPQTFPGGDGIQRYYEITSNTNIGLNATVRFNYFDAELNGLPEGALLLFDSKDNGNTWNRLGASNLNIATNVIEQTGINDFGRLTAATTATFPVEYLDFTAQAMKGRYSLLTWATGSEQNNQGFFIERSNESSNNEWESIGFVEGQGTVTTPSLYEFIDQTPSSGENYYRLRQVDIDGNFEHSEIRSVYFEPGFEVLLYPNPANHMTYLDFELPENRDVTVSLTDASGRLISTSQYSLFSGRNKIGISVENLPDGIYIVRLEGEEMSIPLRLKVD